MKTLIVIDMQNDFVTGALGSKDAQDVVPNVNTKIKNYRDNNDTIIFTRDTHNDDYINTHEGKYLPVPHCIKNTDGWNVMNNLQETAGDNICFIDKPSFGYTNWKDYINDETTSIELIGVCTDICVVSNALILRAMYPEINIQVDSKCCAGTSVEAHNAALTVMKSCHIDII